MYVVRYAIAKLLLFTAVSASVTNAMVEFLNPTLPRLQFSQFLTFIDLLPRSPSQLVFVTSFYDMPNNFIRITDKSNFNGGLLFINNLGQVVYSFRRLRNKNCWNTTGFQIRIFDLMGRRSVPL